MVKFYVKDFMTSLLPRPSMDFVNDWYDDIHEYWSKIQRSTIPTPLPDLKVNVTYFEFSC